MEQFGFTFKISKKWHLMDWLFLWLQGQLGFRAPTMQGCFDIPDGLQDMVHNLKDHVNDVIFIYFLVSFYYFLLSLACIME